ncbi:hypothetical protein O988_07507 [Pseudogymnoascus sp. VKM F-3808]|nr:hypothetical protein O988_07507 [Pseudogymnoascus sp. VKM F-3808]
MILGSSARRTPTGSQTIFDLNHPDPVVFDFSASSTAVDITIPPYSGWITQHHWHETAQACETIEPQEGSYMISLSAVATRGTGLHIGDGKGFVLLLRPGTMVQWKRNPHQAGAENEATSFRLKGPVEMLDFYRQVCSVNQDAELYFQLPSTPFWLRGIYAFWAWIPYFGTRMRAWLTSQLLWVQLQVIYFKNDYFTHEGSIPFTRPWWDLPGGRRPPEKWMNLSQNIKMDCPDVPPTPLERELWVKALQTPDQITEAERLVILRQPDLITQVANSLKVSGLTPEELQNKALTSPELMTYEECRLIQNNYHIWSRQESTANSPVYWGPEDFMACTKARQAVATSRDNAVKRAASARSRTFAAIQREEIQASMKKHAEVMYQPCKWVENLINPSIPWTLQTVRWGFVIFRGDAIDWNNNGNTWDRFLHYTNEFILADKNVSENNPEILRSIFQQRLAEEAVPNPRVPSNTFLLVTPEVVDACLNTSTPWIWAYDAKFVPSATLPPTSASGTEHYEGRLRVSLYSLYTWFYAVRSEELYNMALFWEKAQNQGQVWSVTTMLGRYHQPFVLLEKGSSYSFHTYELDNGP